MAANRALIEAVRGLITCQGTEQADGIIHKILYEEEVRGSMAREDIYKMARALSRDTSPSSKRLP